MAVQRTQNKIEDEWKNIWEGAIDTPVDQILGGFLFKNGYKEFVKYFEDTDYSLLEVGAGSGRYGLALARAHTRASVTVTDPTDSSVDLMSKIKLNFNIVNATVKKEDALHLSFPDNTFEYVLADAVIQHIVDYPKAIEEMLRVLKPGGKLIVSTVNTFNPPHFLYKSYLLLFRKKYEYNYENTFSRSQLYRAVNVFSSGDIVLDGFAVAYGLLRLKKYHKIYAKMGGALDYLIKSLDKITGRLITRVFGFEIFAVITKIESIHGDTN